MKDKYKICAVIVSYNIGERINNCIKSIINQVHEVIIVDNYSNSETIKELNKFQTYSNVQVIYNNANYGIAKALNIGVNLAISKGYNWILTLDHDSIASENMINKMIETYKSMNDRENIGIICTNIYDTNKEGYLIEDNDFKKDYKILKVAVQSGSLIKTEIFKEIGMFNEELFIYYVDVEFSERLKIYNYKIVQSNHAILYHEEGKKTKKILLGKKYYYDNYSKLAIYYIARNGMYMMKHYNKNKKSYMRRLKNDFKNIIMFDGNKLLKLTYFFVGIVDGIKNRYGKYEHNKYMILKAKSKRGGFTNDNVRQKDGDYKKKFRCN